MKSGLPMGKPIWKVDGRDSENLQKKRYVAHSRKRFTLCYQLNQQFNQTIWGN